MKVTIKCCLCSAVGVGASSRTSFLCLTMTYGGVHSQTGGLIFEIKSQPAGEQIVVPPPVYILKVSLPL